MRKVYCFGNPLIPNDKLALELADLLHVQGFVFVKCINPSELPFGEELIILDVVDGLRTPELILDLGKLVSRNPVTAHDLDLGHWLQMGEKIGLVKHAKIIGLPPNMNKDSARKEVELILRQLLIPK